MRRSGWLALGAVLALFAGACGDDDDDEDDDGGNGGEISFATQVHPILTAKCGTCHGTTSTIGKWGSASADESYTETQQIVDLTTPAQSPLIVSGNGGGGHPDALTDAEVQTITTWIQQGAMDN